MMVGMRVLRGGFAAALMLVALPLATVATVALVPSQAAAQTAASIGVEGNRRIEADTIRSYFKPGPSGRLDNAAVDDGLKALINTGLFSDVRIEHRGGRLVVVVSENAVLGRVVFEGNKKIKDEQLTAEVQSKPRGTLSRAMVQSDTQRIIEIYRHAGRYDVTVTPEYIEQPNNRVDLIFVIQEGKKTGVQAINFAPRANASLSASPLTLSASASSILTVSFTSSTTAVCTVSGTTLTLLATGTCTILADQAGDTAYEPAPTVQQSFTVTPALLTITPAAATGLKVGASYSQQNPAAGGVAPYLYSLRAGAFVPGTTLDTGTGTVSGTPTVAGSFSYIVRVTVSYTYNWITPLPSWVGMGSTSTISKMAYMRIESS